MPLLQCDSISDKNGNNALEKDEAIALMQAVNAARPDGHAFYEEIFEKLFTARSVNGAFPNDAAHETLLKRGQTFGFITLKLSF